MKETDAELLQQNQRYRLVVLHLGEKICEPPHLCSKQYFTLMLLCHINVLSD